MKRRQWRKNMKRNVVFIDAAKAIAESASRTTDHLCLAILAISALRKVRYFYIVDEPPLICGEWVTVGMITPNTVTDGERFWEEPDGQENGNA